MVQKNLPVCLEHDFPSLKLLTDPALALQSEITHCLSNINVKRPSLQTGQGDSCWCSELTVVFSRRTQLID
jgi:hypothetical protein